MKFTKGGKSWNVNLFFVKGIKAINKGKGHVFTCIIPGHDFSGDKRALRRHLWKEHSDEIFKGVN